MHMHLFRPALIMPKKIALDSSRISWQGKVVPGYWPTTRSAVLGTQRCSGNDLVEGGFKLLWF